MLRFGGTSIKVFIIWSEIPVDSGVASGVGVGVAMADSGSLAFGLLRVRAGLPATGIVTDGAGGEAGGAAGVSNAFIMSA